MPVTLNGHSYSTDDFTSNGGYGYLAIFPEQIFSDMLAELQKTVSLGASLFVPVNAIIGNDPPVGTEPLRVGGGARFNGDVYSKNAINGGAFRGGTPVSNTVADGQTITLFSSQVSGLLVLSDGQNGVAIYALDNRGGSNRCQKILSLGPVAYNAAAGTAGSVNIYTATTSVLLENRTGSLQGFSAAMYSSL